MDGLEDIDTSPEEVVEDCREEAEATEQEDERDREAFPRDGKKGEPDQSRSQSDEKEADLERLRSLHLFSSPDRSVRSRHQEQYPNLRPHPGPIAAWSSMVMVRRVAFACIPSSVVTALS